MRHVTRRDLLKATGWGLASWAAGDSRAGARPQASRRHTNRPNILVIMSDEHNAAVTGCYGNRLVRTPNLDGLADRGVTFDACYCNSPLCVPSRMAFTAGKYISRTGAWSNNCWLPSADYPTLPRVLAGAGYEPFLCGKMHYDKTRRYGFTEIGGKMNQSTKTGKGGRRRPDDLAAKPGHTKRFDNFYPAEDSSILSHDRKVTAGMIDFLRNRKADDKPFLLAAGYLAPHFPLIVPQKYWDHYRGKVPMPVIPAGHLESQPLNYQHLRIGFDVEDAPAEIVRKGRELYYGLTEWLDMEIGKVLNALAQSEVADNTVVIYTSDHGENMGEHGLWWKNCMYESAARIPLIVRWPSRWRGRQRRSQACSTVDLVQTIADLAGTKTPSDWNGDSMVEWLDDSSVTWKDLAVSEYYAHNIASGYAMLRMGRYKYVYHTPADERHEAERELYDLQTDPGEFHNLANKAQQQDRVAQMHAALVAELGEHPDDTERRCRADYAKGYQRSDVKTKKSKNKEKA